MNNELSNVLYEQFAQLGLDKKAVQMRFSMDDFERLQNGEKTSLKTINVSTKDLNFDLDAKFSMRKTEDGTFSLRVHTLKNEVATQYKFTENDMQRLKENDAIVKIDDSTKTPYLYQLDNQIKEIMRIEVSKIHVPDFIQDIQLSQNQKELLRQGNAIELQKEGQKLAVKLDLNRQNGFEVKTLERTIEQNISVEKEKTRGMKM